jgi:hypothetical protein
MLETLAAAYASAGRFEQALENVREAQAGYAAAGQPEPPRLGEALARYRRGEPFVRPARLE